MLLCTCSYWDDWMRLEEQRNGRSDLDYNSHTHFVMWTELVLYLAICKISLIVHIHVRYTCTYMYVYMYVHLTQF